jgi:hypothetical protein
MRIGSEDGCKGEVETWVKFHLMLQTAVKMPCFGSLLSSGAVKLANVQLGNKGSGWKSTSEKKPYNLIHEI